jgi:hypothetical protein
LRLCIVPAVAQSIDCYPDVNNMGWGQQIYLTNNEPETGDKKIDDAYKICTEHRHLLINSTEYTIDPEFKTQCTEVFNAKDKFWEDFRKKTEEEEKSYAQNKNKQDLQSLHDLGW